MISGRAKGVVSVIDTLGFVPHVSQHSTYKSLGRHAQSIFVVAEEALVAHETQQVIARYVSVTVHVGEAVHVFCDFKTTRAHLAAKLPPTLGPFRTRSNPTLAQP